MAESIQKLYCQSGLIEYALSTLKSKKWYVVAKGIRGTHNSGKGSPDGIVILVNHPKKEIRKSTAVFGYLISF